MHEGMEWEHALWAAGHRVTRQRAVILDAVCAGGGHTSLGEVYARVRRADRAIDRSTVYRALHLFVELGIVLAADTGTGETLYEVTKPHPHHHLICRRCGRDEEIGDPALRAMSDQVRRDHGFRVATDHLVLFGECIRCGEAGPLPGQGR
ncbi:MAG: Fur family transcriptional regulator [Thermomicrobiales bacterium]